MRPDAGSSQNARTPAVPQSYGGPGPAPRLGGTSLRLCERRGAVQVGDAFPSRRTGGWREDPADEDEVVGWVATARLAHHTVNFRRGAHPPRGEERRAVNARLTGGWREDPADEDEESGPLRVEEKRSGRLICTV
jgi:hypothetical protein